MSPFRAVLPKTATDLSVYSSLMQSGHSRKWQLSMTRGVEKKHWTSFSKIFRTQTEKSENIPVGCSTGFQKKHDCTYIEMLIVMIIYKVVFM